MGVALVYKVRMVSSDVLVGGEGGIRFNNDGCAGAGMWCPSRSARMSEGAVNEDVGRVDRVSSSSMGGRMLA